PPKRKRSGFTFIMMVVISLFIADDLMRRWTNKGLAQRAMEITGLTEEAELLPRIMSGPLAFPDVPPGLYAGSITNFIKGVDLPFSLVRVNDSDEITFVIGISGWTPVRIKIEDAAEGSIRIRSNGFVLSFSGVANGDHLEGTFV